MHLDASHYNFRMAKTMFRRAMYVQTIFYCNLTLEHLLKACKEEFCVSDINKIPFYGEELERVAILTSSGVKEGFAQMLAFAPPQCMTTPRTGDSNAGSRGMAQDYLSYTRDTSLWIEEKLTSES